MVFRKKNLLSHIFVLICLLLAVGCGGGSGSGSGGGSSPEDPGSDSLNITTASIPAATVGASYAQNLTAKGGSSPYSWSITSGTLPQGLTLNTQTGSISGLPAADITSVFTVQVADAEETTVQKEFSLTISSSAPETGCDCEPLDTIVGQTTTVSSVSELESAINTINSSGGNRTVLLEDGDYMLNNTLGIKGDNVVIRSVSGNRTGVTIEGEGMDGDIEHVFLIQASNVTIADISLGEVANHGIQIQGENGANNLLVHNVRIFNTNEQMLKGSYGNSTGSDNGIVECSLFEYTETFGPQFYIGGIDVHNGKDWIVRKNTFKNIRSPDADVAEHAVHFWSNSENPTIEKNIIINCDRGIGLGLNSSRCTGGTIRNNMIYANNQGLRSDVGIALESANNIRVYNNTIYFDHGYGNAIEYRFADSFDNEIINNLTNKAITSRNGGTATVRNNNISAVSSWFVDTASGNLHLDTDNASIVDAGEGLSSVSDDIDCESRSDNGIDIGADEI